MRFFSKTRRSEFPNDVTTWGQLGLDGDWAKARISLYGRNSASGTYGFFKKQALFKGDYKDQVKEQPGSASVVQGITEDRFAIGYSGIGYQTSGVRVVPLAKAEGQEFKQGSMENVLNGFLSPRALPVYLHEQGSRPSHGSASERVLQVYFFQRGSRNCRQGWLYARAV